MVRTILTWRILGENVVGTCHVPTPGRAGGLSGAPAVGVLLLNAGPAPRSGNSDLSVRIGDRLALRGFPVFRFDLTGLGDSSGPTPTDLDSYWREVLDGRNDQATVALIERIQLEFGVSRVIVGGLCAAALPSVRALRSGRAAPAGLILLEPNFCTAVQRKLDGARRDTSRGPFSPSESLRRGLVALESSSVGAIARAARSVHAWLHLLSRKLGPSLPRDANVPLVTRWRESSERGVHSLLVVAAGQGTDRYVTRILESMPDRASDAVTCVRVPKTNHLFTNGAGRDAVIGALERWVMENFDRHAEPVLQTAGRA